MAQAKDQPPVDMFEEAKARLHKALPEVDLEKLGEKTGQGTHNIGEKWDRIARELQYFLELI